MKVMLLCFCQLKARTAMLLAEVATNIRAAGSRYMAMLLQGATLEELQMQKQQVQDLLNQNIRQAGWCNGCMSNSDKYCRYKPEATASTV